MAEYVDKLVSVVKEVKKSIDETLKTSIQTTPPATVRGSPTPKSLREQVLK